MKHFLISCLLLATSSCALAADDRMQQFLVAKRAYLEALRSGANNHLDEVHENANAEIRARVPRNQVRLEIREGMDRGCHSATFKIGYVNHQSKTIVVCEEDVAAASDYVIGLTLVVGLQIQEHWALLDKHPPDAPLPQHLNRQMKDRLLLLAKYLADTNKRVKDQRYVTQRYGMQACRAWEVVHRMATNPDTLNACTRNDLSRSESLRAAKWSAEILRFAIGAAQAKFGAKPKETMAGPIDSIEAETAMNDMRSELIDRILYYAVAHEFGHLATGADQEAKLSEIEREKLADRFAASAVNEFLVRTTALPMLAHTFEILWTVSEDSALTKGRLRQLGVVVFCERGHHLRSGNTTPFEEKFLRMMGDEFCSQGTAR